MIDILTDFNPFLMLLFSFELFLSLCSCISCIIFIFYIFLNKDKPCIQDLFTIYRKKRTFKSKLKLYSLTLGVLIPNFIFIYSPPFFMWFVSFSLIFIMSEKFKILYIVLLVKLYYVLFSFFFGIFYEKTSYFPRYINKVFFDDDKKTAKFVLSFFFGNMWSRAWRIGAAATVSGTGYHQQLSNEKQVSQLMAESNVDSALAKTAKLNGGFLKEPIDGQKYLDLVALEQERLSSQQALHGLQESIINTGSLVKDGIIKLVEASS